jgi:hypothetical protein
MTFSLTREIIPETKVPNRRLGRHVNHDSRSLQYRVAQVDSPVTKAWERKTPILDQGDLGSCTGNAMAGALGTEPFYSTLVSKLNDNSLTLDEPEAVKLYSEATVLDGYSGTYLPTDTGSDGLSVAKAAQKFGLITGYTHALSPDDMIAGLQKGPGIVGVNWMTGMDDINSITAEIKPTGSVRGGHEFEVWKVDLELEQFWFYNSWSSSWGRKGAMFMTISNFEVLLKQNGDATFFTPLNQPAPTPTPPSPKPVPPEDQHLMSAMDPWERTIVSRITRAGKAKVAYDAWKLAKGY